ncbi:MAG: hypothetical protein Q7T71_02885, partial [Herbiconiux sp.]|nr:hypothetical protein [Herbiconiux sp.]
GLLEGLQDGPAADGLRPQPALADLPGLVERVAATGMRVELEHLGAPRPLTAAQELSVYRIVQESLTNALKHAGGQASASVSLSWEGEGLVLSVVSTGSGPAGGVVAGAGAGAGGGAGEGAGFGIRGMKDRAHLAGGWLTAGSEGEGEFVVTAYLPTRRVAAPASVPAPAAEDAA